jgi:predicted choloylglycine hydrolase
MQKRIKKTLKIILLALLSLLLILSLFVAYLYFSADACLPDTEIIVSEDEELVADKGTYKEWQGNFLRQSETGLWELKIKGNSFERGVATGKLTENLLYFQEKVFVDQIKEMIPSESYLKFLRFFLQIFNRNLGENVIPEYREEIYGISQFCTNEYNFIGTPYERQLNYHAAHDIGHALQDLMLVGCSSFAAWGEKSEDSTLIVGRNFDFYMGDEFAKNKIVMFVEPEKGYKFASVSWAGMIGVLSGMNETGLTVTINAAKSAIPTGSATPISLLVREILQYASTIDEAFEIAKKRKIFVSEAILIGSAKDKRAAIIEKSPTTTALFEVNDEQIISTNHFQSEAFANDERNIQNIAESDSYYRFQRLEELLSETEKINPQNTVDILRNRFGHKNEEIGLSNEMAINQFIAHHSVIFKPEEKKMWVSTSPWQSGKFVMYDLNKIFSENVDFSTEIYDEAYTIAADTTFLNSEEYKNLTDYRRLNHFFKQEIKHNLQAKELKSKPDSLTKFENSNPEYFYTYEVLGDYNQSLVWLDEVAKHYPKEAKFLPEFQFRKQAIDYYQKALTKKIPRLSERKRIENKIPKSPKGDLQKQ